MRVSGCSGGVAPKHTSERHAGENTTDVVNEKLRVGLLDSRSFSGFNKHNRE